MVVMFEEKVKSFLNSKSLHKSVQKLCVVKMLLVAISEATVGL